MLLMVYPIFYGISKIEDNLVNQDEEEYTVLDLNRNSIINYSTILVDKGDELLLYLN